MSEKGWDEDVIQTTRSMVYKGMVYKGQNISSTEDFWKNKDIH